MGPMQGKLVFSVCSCGHLFVDWASHPLDLVFCGFLAFFFEKLGHWSNNVHQAFNDTIRLGHSQHTTYPLPSLFVCDRNDREVLLRHESADMSVLRRVMQSQQQL